MATGYSHATACSNVGSLCRLTQCIEAGCRRHCVAPLPGLRLLLGYRNYYAIHGSPYTSAHVLIENTLVQHKMAKNSRMALCCQNRVSKGTGRTVMGFIVVPVSLFIAPLVTVLGLLKKKKKKKKKKKRRISTKRRFSRFQVSYLKHSNGSYKWLR